MKTRGGILEDMCRRDTTVHTHEGRAGTFLRGRLRGNMRGDYQSRKLASVPIIIWEASVCLCLRSHPRLHLTTGKWLFSLQPCHLLAHRTACSMSQRSEPVINTAPQRQAVVNRAECGVLKSKGQGLDFTSTEIISTNTMTQ